MSLTNKEIYDLDNRNVASQNVKLGTLLDKIEKKETVEALTEKQIYDLNNESVAFQEVQMGNIIDALASNEGGEITDLTDTEKEMLTNSSVALQNVDFGEYIQDLIDEQKEPTPQLDTPTISLVDTNYLYIYNTVANATSYDIYIDNSFNINLPISQDPVTSLDLSSILSEVGDYSIKVKAKAEGYAESEFSNEVTYTVSPAPQLQLNVPYTVTRSFASIGEGSTLTFKEDGNVRIVGTSAPIDADFVYTVNRTELTITFYSSNEVFTIVSDTKISNTNEGGLNIDAEILPESETWVFNDTINFTNNPGMVETSFTSNNKICNKINITNKEIVYFEESTGDYIYAMNEFGEWTDEAYKTVEFDEAVDLTSTFGQWLSAIATKQ